MNRGQIRQGIISILRETATPTGWSVAELDNYINDVYSDTAKETKAVVLTTDLPVAANQALVDLPKNSFQVLALIDKSTGKPIDHVDWLYISQVNARFAERSSERPLYAASFGMHQLLLYPKYGAAGTITGTFVVDSTPMTSDTDIPALPEMYHKGIVFGAAHLAMMKDAKRNRIHSPAWSDENSPKFFENDVINV